MWRAVDAARKRELDRRLRDAMFDYERLMDEIENHVASAKLKTSIAHSIAGEIREIENEILQG